MPDMRALTCLAKLSAEEVSQALDAWVKHNPYAMRNPSAIMTGIVAQINAVRASPRVQVRTSGCHWCSSPNPVRQKTSGYLQLTPGCSAARSLQLNQCVYIVWLLSMQMSTALCYNSNLGRGARRKLLQATLSKLSGRLSLPVAAPSAQHHTVLPLQSAPTEKTTINRLTLKAQLPFARLPNQASPQPMPTCMLLKTMQSNSSLTTNIAMEHSPMRVPEPCLPHAPNDSAAYQNVQLQCISQDKQQQQRLHRDESSVKELPTASSPDCRPVTEVMRCSRDGLRIMQNMSSFSVPVAEFADQLRRPGDNLLLAVFNADDQSLHGLWRAAAKQPQMHTGPAPVEVRMHA